MRGLSFLDGLQSPDDVAVIDFQMPVMAQEAEFRKCVLPLATTVPLSLLGLSRIYFASGCISTLWRHRCLANERRRFCATCLRLD